MKPLEDMGKYATVVIDPPWGLHVSRSNSREGGYAAPTYETLNLAEIAYLPVYRVLESDATVFCWTTNAMLPFTFRVLESWYLSYWFTMVWHKPGGPKGKGLPTYNAEFVVVGRVGFPEFTDTKAFQLASTWPRGGHSEKPEGFYDLLRRVTPAPRLDVFGRRRIVGFQSWGDEAPEEPAPDHYQTVMDG